MLINILRSSQSRGSAPSTDVVHKIRVDLVDDAGVDTSHLEQSWNLEVPGAAIAPNHVSHAPGTIDVSDDHFMPALT